MLIHINYYHKYFNFPSIVTSNQFLKDLTQKIAENYTKLNVNETKVRVSDNLKQTERHMNKLIDEYEKESLVVAAKFHRSVVTWVNQVWPKTSERMDKMDVKERTQNWMEMGIALQLIRDLGDMQCNSKGNATSYTEAESLKNI